MGLSILNNVSSTIAMNNLSGASKGQSNSIQRLSSGLRINGAQDDPSGLAISERLRTQIRGLGRASMNAQDGISYMQTAEGALNETHSVLQRMRELSVQAANGTLTASDRQEIQKEVTQLAEEVDRISTSTEFNTKKLLNGDASALWSSSSENIGAVVRGKVREGNYALEITAEAGKNQVLKTDIFEVKDGIQAVDNVDLSGSEATISGTVSVAGVSLDFDFAGFEYTWEDSTVAATGLAMAAAINEHEVLNKYINAVVLTGGGIRLDALQEGEYANQFRMKLNDTASGADLGLTSTVNWTSFTGGTTTTTGIVEIDNPVGMMNGFPYDSSGVDQSYTLTKASAAAAANTAVEAAAFAQGQSSGFDNNSTMTAVNAVISTVKDGGAYAMVEIMETVHDTAGSLDLKLKFSFDEGKTWNTMDFADVTMSGATEVRLSDGTNALLLSASGSKTFNSGDKLLIALNDLSANAAVSDQFVLTTPADNGLGAATQTSRTYTYQNNSLDKNDATLETVQIDTSTGEWYTGSFHIDMGDNNLVDGNVTFDVSSGGTVNSGTKLTDIGRFYDDDGNFVLGESGKTITMYNGTGDSTSIYIDGGDTIGEVADKINDAMKNELDLGVGNANVDDHLADFIAEGVPGTDGAVEGTIVIRSSMAGAKGEITFSAEEDLLNALSLATVQASTETATTVNVTDAHTGVAIGSDTVTDSVLHNVIDGIDVDINPKLGLDVSWNGSSFDFSSKTSDTEFLHVVDNAKSFQIGANQNQTMDSFIGEMGSHALGVDRVLVVSQDAAQSAIGTLDQAIDRVSSERARIGAVVNRLEHTINNLNVQQENAISAESRIRDLDIAKEATDMAKWQILTQASTSMLGKANQMGQGLLGLLR